MTKLRGKEYLDLDETGDILNYSYQEEKIGFMDFITQIDRVNSARRNASYFSQ